MPPAPVQVPSQRPLTHKSTNDRMIMKCYLGAANRSDIYRSTEENPRKPQIGGHWWRLYDQSSPQMGYPSLIRVTQQFRKERTGRKKGPMGSNKRQFFSYKALFKAIHHSFASQNLRMMFTTNCNVSLYRKINFLMFSYFCHKISFCYTSFQIKLSSKYYINMNNKLKTNIRNE